MTITLTREEAQQVLDALYSMNGTEFLCQAAHHGKKDWHGIGDVCPVAARYMAARETLRARLSAPEPEYRDVVIKGDLWRIEFLPDHAASVVLVRANYEAQPEPEPVAWYLPSDEGFDSLFRDHRTVVACTGNKWEGWQPLYTAPPQREWQGLTDEEMRETLRPFDRGSSFSEKIRAIEAKLREKNT